MTSIKPISVPANSELAFKGAKNHAKELLALAKDMKCMPSGKPVSLEEAKAMMERMGGVTEAMRRSPAELKETVLRETMLGNTDYVKGINDILAKNAAKNGYKP